MHDAVRSVSEHYAHFPYPTRSLLIQPLPPRFERDVLSFLLRRRREDWLPADAKIWVAGCGTQQGAHVAMCYPQADVLATDVSDETLRLARGLAEQLGLENVRFEQHDLMSGGREPKLDLIFSTGVIHHLPEPELGMAHLAESLAPRGALYLMVYSATHRESLAAIRRSIAMLARDDEDADARYALSGDVLRHTLGSKRCMPHSHSALQQLLSSHEADRGFVADVLLQPQEVSYDIDGLLGLLAGAGLAHSAWLHPAHWRLDHYIDDGDLISRFEALEPVAQWKVVYSLAGRSSPALTLLADRRDEPRREAYDEAELLAMPLTCRQKSRVARVDLGRIVSRGVLPSYSLEGEALMGHDRGFPALDAPWREPAEVGALLDACDGKATLGELVDRFSAERGREQVLAAYMRQLPSGHGVVVPSL